MEAGHAVRDGYHERLDAIGSTLVVMTTLTGEAVGRATSALLYADMQLADSVLAANETVAALGGELDGRVCDFFGRQESVKRDLRRIVCAVRIGAEVGRMGDLAGRIAQVARLRHPERAVPAALAQIVAGMGQFA